MWLNILSMGLKTAGHIYKNKQRTKMLMSDAQSMHAEKMARGENEYKAKVIESNDNGWKDEFVLVLVSLPILVLVYSIFTDDPEIRNRLDMFFEYFKNLPYWYQAIFIGIVSAIYGLKGADIMRKPKQMDKADFLDIINEYKEQVRLLKEQISELEDACKSKDAALKRSLQKLEYTAQDLDKAHDEINAKKTVEKK